MAFDKKLGREVMDSTPVAVPVQFTRQTGMNEAIRRIIESREMQREAFRQGKETFQEANDFDVGEDAPDFKSPHEEIYDPVDEEVLNRLTSDEYARKVEARFQQLEALVRPKEKSDGVKSNKGRDRVGSGRVGKSGKVVKGKSVKDDTAYDKGDTSEADRSDPGVGDQD